MPHIVALLLNSPPVDGASRPGAASPEADLSRRLAALALVHLPWPHVKLWICHGPDLPKTEARSWLAEEIPAGSRAEFHAVEEEDTAGRMEAISAAAFALDDTETLTFLTADCPDARWPFFIATHKMAAEGIDAVFGAAEDGSCYLTMVRAHHPALYRRVPWNGADGGNAAMAAAERAGLRITQLRQTLRRIRSGADLAAWREEKRGRFVAQHPGVLKFTPQCMERVWGGRELATRYNRKLAREDMPYGESWDLVDRSDVQSVVEGGPLDGTPLHDLWLEWREEIFGAVTGARFPLLLKILDARDRLSIQVHPPADVAPSLGGEPKTEMWYIADAEPDAALYVGLKAGVTREDFAQAIAGGTVEEVTHRIPVRTGDHIFIPSGRLHAIGAGLVIFEIQQNSDTTYRVFDWNRMGTDGKPRELHVRESLACIDYTDFEPSISHTEQGVLAECAHFRVERRAVQGGEAFQAGTDGQFLLLSVVSGEISFLGALPSRRPEQPAPETITARAGDSLVIPALQAGPDSRTVTAVSDAVCLLTFIPH